MSLKKAEEREELLQRKTNKMREISNWREEIEKLIKKIPTVNSKEQQLYSHLLEEEEKE